MPNYIPAAPGTLPYHIPVASGTLQSEDTHSSTSEGRATAPTEALPAKDDLLLILAAEDSEPEDVPLDVRLAAVLTVARRTTWTDAIPQGVPAQSSQRTAWWRKRREQGGRWA